MKYFITLVVILTELSFVDLVYSQSGAGTRLPVSGVPLPLSGLTLSKGDVQMVDKFMQCLTDEKKKFDPSLLQYDPKFRSEEDVSATSRAEQFHSFYTALQKGVSRWSGENSAESDIDYISTKTSTTCFNDFMQKQEEWLRQLLIERADSLGPLLTAWRGGSSHSPSMKKQVEQLQFKMSYFLFIYKAPRPGEVESQDGHSVVSASNNLGLSWSIIDTNKEPRILLSLPSYLMEGEEYSNNDRKTKNRYSFLFELRRQLVHEFYVRHDAGQWIGNGMSGLNSLARGQVNTYSCQTHDLFSTGLSIGQDRQVKGDVIKKILINYRAAQFEFILGFGPRLKSFTSLKEIIEKYDEQPLLPLTNSFTEVAMNLIFDQLQASLSGSGQGLACPRGMTTIRADDANDPQLELLLKPKLVFEDLPQYSSGPGCVSCGSGWNMDDSRDRD